MASGEFSVYQFFMDDKYECVRSYVDAEEAMKAVQHYTNNVATRLGITKRVIVTDGGDFTTYEWINGKGVVFPTQEDIDKLNKGIEEGKAAKL